MAQVPVSVSAGPVQVNVMVDSSQLGADAAGGDSVNWPAILAFVTALLQWISQYFPTPTPPTPPSGAHPSGKK